MGAPSAFRAKERIPSAELGYQVLRTQTKSLPHLSTEYPRLTTRQRPQRDRVQRIGQLSDNILHVGPFSLGVDGVLSWIPGVGELYSLVAGAFILIQGARAGVPVSVLAGAAFIATLPLGRAGEPKEIADAIEFISSDKAGFLTGQVITLDGGVMAA